jgi:glycosyltransferase involved in cell wall biosynthesis
LDQPLLTVVVPCYNEDEVFVETSSQLSDILKSLIEEKLIKQQSMILFVDDGSSDRTWDCISKEIKHNPLVSGIKLARNFGHQNALLAGLCTAKNKSDCVISIDADLQDDIQVIRQFVLKYREGFDIIYGVRRCRQTDTLLKRKTAQWFYRIMQSIGVRLVYNHADYRLMSKRALEHLVCFDETKIFLRGIVPLIGFRTAEVLYDRKDRFAGLSKYPLRKMLTFALNGITSFSIAPIRVIALLGFLAFLFSCLAGGYAIIQKVLGHTLTGWTSLMASIWFIGGLLLMSIGLIGEYIGNIYEEVKKRPRYIIESDLFSEQHE